MEKYVITNKDNTKKTIIENVEQIFDGDLAIGFNSDSENLFMFWDEEKGFDYINHIYYFKGDDDLIILKNLTEEIPFLVTLSNENYDLFEIYYKNVRGD